MKNIAIAITLKIKNILLKTFFIPLNFLRANSMVISINVIEIPMMIVKEMKSCFTVIFLGFIKYSFNNISSSTVLFS